MVVTEVDEPLFEGSQLATAVPLAVRGQLFGVVNLEYGAGQEAERERDAPLLYQLANHAALGVRNVRSIEELTYLKTYLENLIEHANALVLVVNRSREVVVWNAALVRTTGFSKERVAGDDLLDLVPAEERPGLEQVLRRGFAGEAVAGYETRLLREGGGEARVAINTAPVAGSSGEVDDVIAIGQDLTLVRSLQAAAEHAERLAGIGRLVAGVVHELNNPLTAVNMYSDVLHEKLSHAGHDPADLEKLRAILEGGQRIQRLARDLVAYARPAGARTEPVDLAGVVEEAVRLAKPGAEGAERARRAAARRRPGHRGKPREPRAGRREPRHERRAGDRGRRPDHGGPRAGGRPGAAHGRATTARAWRRTWRRAPSSRSSRRARARGSASASPSCRGSSSGTAAPSASRPRPVKGRA